MKIYADILFSINFFMDLFIIYASAVVLRYKNGIKKAAAVALASAFMGCVFQILFIGNVPANVLLGVFLLGFMVKAYFKPKEIKTFMHQSSVMLMVSFFTSGFFVWLSGYSNLKYFVANYFSLTAVVFAVCFVSVMMVFWLWHKKIRQTIFERKKYIDAELFWKDRKTDIRIFVDSGCMLEKSLSGRSVIIVSLFEIKGLFSDKFVLEMTECKGTEEILLLWQKYDMADDIEMISFSTAAGMGHLPCLKCRGSFRCDGKEITADVSAGIFMGNLFAGNDCGGIIGAEELENLMGGD